MVCGFPWQLFSVERRSSVETRNFTQKFCLLNRDYSGCFAEPKLITNRKLSIGDPLMKSILEGRGEIKYETELFP